MKIKCYFLVFFGGGTLLPIISDCLFSRVLETYKKQLWKKYFSWKNTAFLKKIKKLPKTATTKKMGEI